MSRLTVGTITMPHGVSDKETLLWFHNWVKSSSRNIEELVCIVDVIFFSEEDLSDTLKFITKRNWPITGLNEIMTPEGSIIRFSYDRESDEQLKSIRTHD